MSRTSGTKYNLPVLLGLLLKNSNNLWVVMGKTSAWADEESPTAPSPSNYTIVEPFLAIKPILSSMAKPVTLETYNALNENDRAAVMIDEEAAYLELVGDADVYDETARYLYIKTLYDPVVAGHPGFTDFRVYYLTYGLTPATDHEADLWLADADVDDYGITLYENAGTAIPGGYAIILPVLLELR